MMTFSSKIAGLAMASLLVLAACGDRETKLNPKAWEVETGRDASINRDEPGLFDIFSGDADAGVKVNRFLWTASLDVLDFLPFQSADPFTGVISTGYGTPPGGGRAYTFRETVAGAGPGPCGGYPGLESVSGPGVCPR